MALVNPSLADLKLGYDLENVNIVQSTINGVLLWELIIQAPGELYHIFGRGVLNWIRDGIFPSLSSIL